MQALSLILETPFEALSFLINCFAYNNLKDADVCAQQINKPNKMLLFDTTDSNCTRHCFCTLWRIIFAELAYTLLR